jgi:hypothetical protein
MMEANLDVLGKSGCLPGISSIYLPYKHLLVCPPIALPTATIVGASTCNEILRLVSEPDLFLDNTDC